MVDPTGYEQVVVQMVARGSGNAAGGQGVLIQCEVAVESLAHQRGPQRGGQGPTIEFGGIVPLR